MVIAASAGKGPRAANKVVKYFFDPISPYAWLAWKPLLVLCEEATATLLPTPVLFAGLLNKHGQLGPAEIPPKKMYIMKDVARRAHLRGMSVNPPPSHPFNPLLALRSLTVVTEDSAIPEKLKFRFISNILDTCWVKGQDLSDQKTVVAAANDVGLDGKDVVAKANSERIKGMLKSNTDDAISRGVFGVPTYIIDDDIYWGSESDTLDHVKRAVDGQPVLVPPELLLRWANIKASASRR